MYPVAELLQRRIRIVKDDRLVVVRDLTLGLGVDADHVAVVPDLLQQLCTAHNRRRKKTKTEKGVGVTTLVYLFRFSQRRADSTLSHTSDNHKRRRSL